MTRQTRQMPRSGWPRPGGGSSGERVNTTVSQIPGLTRASVLSVSTVMTQRSKILKLSDLHNSQIIIIVEYFTEMYQIHHHANLNNTARFRQLSKAVCTIKMYLLFLNLESSNDDPPY